MSSISSELVKLINIETVQSFFLVTAVLLAFASNPASAQSDKLSPIGPVRGRQLMQKANSGEKLTDEEQAYLERVKKAIRDSIIDIRASAKIAAVSLSLRAKTPSSGIREAVPGNAFPRIDVMTVRANCIPSMCPT